MRYKTVVWDIMQMMFKNFNDHQLHCVIRFNSHIDEERLKRAVMISESAFPIIGCKFSEKSSFNHPCWEECSFAPSDMVKVIATSDTEKTLDRLIVYKTNEVLGPQLRIYVVRTSTYDALCVILNHMVSDAAGFKEYLYMLSSIYSNLKNGSGYKCPYKMGSRGTEQIFKRFGFFDKIRILKASSKLSKYDIGVYFGLEGDINNPFIVRRRIPKEKFILMKEYSKRNDVTINDVLLAAYIKALSATLKVDHIVLPCPVDLRKYLPQRKTEGISNFVSNMICDVKCKDGDTYKDILLKVKECMDREKESFSCLNGPMLLNILFDILPYNVFKSTVSKSFNNPAIAMTNIGIIDKNKLIFDGLDINDAFITGSIKYKPYFQVGVTTFDDEITLTVNLYGTQNDRKRIEKFLEIFKNNCDLK